MTIPSRDVFQGQSPVRWAVSLVLAVGFLVVAAVPASSLGSFYSHLDALSYHVRNRDEGAARAELDEVTAFYERSRRVRMQWFADSYLFADSFLHQAAFSYFTGDYETIVESLQDKIDDHRASYLLGVAKFRLAQHRYRAIEGQDVAALVAKDDIIKEILEQVNPDFERALRSDPGERFDYKWNYDLTSDPAAIRRALETFSAVEPPEVQEMQGEGVPVRRRRG